MARKRMIDPEFWNDEEIGRWSVKARLFYIGLWNFADDEGRLKGHAALLRSQIFPYEEKISVDALKIEVSSKVQWFEIHGQQYGFIRNFSKYQRIDRPLPSKLPSPPELEENSTKFSDNSQNVSPNTTKEKLREVKISKPSFDFECLWNKYPRKLGKTDALLKFRKQVITEQDYADIHKALDNFLKSDASKCELQYIPHGSTWFNNRWRDYVMWSPAVEKKVDEHGVPLEFCTKGKK